MQFSLKKKKITIPPGEMVERENSYLGQGVPGPWLCLEAMQDTQGHATLACVPMSGAWEDPSLCRGHRLQRYWTDGGSEDENECVLPSMHL